MDIQEKAIRDLISSWLDATKAGDADRVLSLMSDDVVLLIAGGPPIQGKAAFAATQAAMNGMRFEGVSEVREIKVFGDWAYAWTHLTVTATPEAGGKAIKRSGNTLSILKKESGGWVIHRDANLLATE